ncbi:MAG TPA: hypothetical protein GX506_03935 [Firmicutes bacterium]|nr:hypothetical protein [Bacillota bacterium]
MSKRILLLLSGAAIVTLILIAFPVLRGVKGSSKYGTPIDTTEAQTVELTSLFANTQAYVGKKVIVDGQAGQVCQTSGCWITVTDGANQLFVQFYDFTVKLRPGTRIRVQGEVRIQNNAPYLVGQGVEVIR